MTRTTTSSQGLVVIQVGCKEDTLQAIPEISNDLVRGGEKVFLSCPECAKDQHHHARSKFPIALISLLRGDL